MQYCTKVPYLSDAPKATCTGTTPRLQERQTERRRGEDREKKELKLKKNSKNIMAQVSLFLAEHQHLQIFTYIFFKKTEHARVCYINSSVTARITEKGKQGPLQDHL